MSELGLLYFIITIGLLCGLTPTLIGMYCTLLASTYGRGHSTKQIVGNSVLFFIGFVGTLTIFASGFWASLSGLSGVTVNYIAISVALLLAIAGAIEIKDYFWYGTSVSHKPHKKIAASIHKKLSSRASYGDALYTGIVAVAASVTNIGLSAIAVACLLTVGAVSYNPGWLAMYALSIIFCLVIILCAVLGHTKISAIVQWNEQSKAVMRLSAGLALVVLSWVLLITINGSISIGFVL
jgi:hypothetical protein